MYVDRIMTRNVLQVSEEMRAPQLAALMRDQRGRSKRIFIQQLVCAV